MSKAAGLGLAAVAASVPAIGILLGMLLIPKAPIEAPPIKPAPLPALELPHELVKPIVVVNRSHKTSRLIPLTFPDNPAARGTYPGLDAWNALNQPTLAPAVPRDPEPTSEVLRPHHRASFAGNNETCRRVGRRQVWVSSKRWRCLR